MFSPLLLQNLGQIDRAVLEVDGRFVSEVAPNLMKLPVRDVARPHTEPFALSEYIQNVLLLPDCKLCRLTVCKHTVQLEVNVFCLLHERLQLRFKGWAGFCRLDTLP